MIRALDLFHGAGGSSLGAELAGAKVTAAIDRWDVAYKCYSKNFPNTFTVNDDIRNINPKGFHDDIGDIDLIIASPECTSHSCAKGSRNGCEESKLTAFEVIKFVVEFRPKWIVIENVIQMVTWERYGELKGKLNDLGYNITENKLNSKDFGVAQSRKRLFLLCSSTGNPQIKFPNKTRRKTANYIINKNGKYNYSPLRKLGRAPATIERAERAISVLGEGSPFLIVYYGSDGSGGWQTLNNPLRTITTIDRFAYVKYTEAGYMMRMLQPEELKLAMGFPKHYKFAETTRRDKIKLIGNAVCPPVMECAIKSLAG